MTVVEAIVYGIWWYAILSAGALLVYPLIYLACQGLPDRGLSLLRPIGIVIVILPVWLLGNITPLPFTGLTVAASGLLLGAVSWGLVARRIEIFPLLRARWFRLTVIEFISGAIYAGYLLLRGFNPEVRGTEKPMELAFLSAAERSNALPVMDPWFAGEPINYYYFGYAVYGSVSKLTGIPTDIVFNLTLATTLAMATVAAAGLAANLVGRFPLTPSWVTGTAGTLTGVLLSFSGNLYAADRLLAAPRDTVNEGWWDGVGWGASRVIQDTGFGDTSDRTVITEFPAFSWTLGDLHPHVLAYPWLIATFALAANLLFVLKRRVSLPAAIFHAVPVGVGIGVLYSANSWDVPVAAMVTLIALFVAGSLAGWSVSFVSGMTAFLAALITAVPFAVNYTAAAGDPATANDSAGGIPGGDIVAGMVGFVDWNRTSFEDLVLVHGGFLAFLFLVLAGALVRPGARTWSAFAMFVAGGATISAAAIVLQTAAIALMGLPILVLAIALSGGDEQTPSSAFLYLLIMASLVLIILLEFVFVHDPFGDRMNTVFKVYFQIWALLSIAIGALLPASIRSIRDHAPVVSYWASLLVLVIVLILVSLYAPVSAYHWNDEFSKWKGLSGLQYLNQSNPHEAAAIQWLRENADSDSVVVEAPGCSYGSENLTPHNRMSMATGIPTILGWEGHEFQWRRQQPRLLGQIDDRQEEIATIYERSLGSDAPRYLAGYGVTHIVVGLHETRGYRNCDVGPPYDEEAIEELDRTVWQPVFQSGPVKVLSPHSRGFVAN